MKFLIIALAMLVMARLPLPHRSTQSRTFQRWLNCIVKIPNLQQRHHSIRWMLIAVIPALVISLMSWNLAGWLWGLPLVVLEVALLVYVLSHINIKQQLDDYKADLASGNVSGALVCAEQIISVPMPRPNDTTSGFDESTLADSQNTNSHQSIAQEQSTSALHEQVIQSLLHRWFEYFFLMVFWYVIADVIGLVLAWASLQYSRSPDTDGYAWRYLYWLEWLPARLLGLTYALAGDFSRAFPSLRQSISQWYRSSADVLYDIASNALQQSSRVSELAVDKLDSRSSEDDESDTQQHFQRLEAWQALHWRCVSVWMVVLGVASVGGILL